MKKGPKKLLKDFFEKGKSIDAKRFMELYRGLSDQEKTEVLKELSLYEPDPEELKKKLLETDIYRLKRELTTPRERFFKEFIRVEGGLKFLLDLRADLRRLGKGEFDYHPMDMELVSLFDSWFNEGFLFIKPITLDTPYRQIAFLKEHDMVHPMTSIEEMAKRLGKDRLCFAMYHVLMPDEPVIFIEVALTKGIAGRIMDIIEGGPSERPDTAVFYSINNTQQGLSGLGLGKLLIARVMEEIKREHPNIKNFCTLSPIPSLWRRYLEPLLKKKSKDFKMKPQDVVELFPEDFRKKLGEGDFLERLYELLKEGDWIRNEELCRELEGPMKKLVFFYITEEKDSRGRPMDPVASFHLGNGAKTSMEYVRFLANIYPYGVRESATFMVNYIYEISWMEQVKNTLPSLFKLAFRRT